MTNLKKSNPLSPEMEQIVAEAARFQGMVPMRAVSEVLAGAAVSLLPQIRFVGTKMRLHSLTERELQTRWLGLSNQLLAEIYERFQIFVTPSRAQLIKDRSEALLDDLLSQVCRFEDISPSTKADMHDLVISAFRQGCEVGEIIQGMPAEQGASSRS